jgi:esterase/lipase
MKNLKNPICFVVALKDESVDNEKTKEFYYKNNNPKNKFVEIVEADHLTINHELKCATKTANEIINFFDSLII